MYVEAPRVELALLRRRAAYKALELDAALRIDWGWRVPRLQLEMMDMLIATCEEELVAA